MIKVEGVSGGYGEKFRLNEISFHVDQGEFFGIIGPNGSGKTTLVKMLSGILKQERGTIFIDDRKLNEYRPKELAKKLAVLPQLTELSFRFTVRETIALGRYAHQSGLFSVLTPEDEKIINDVMEYTHVKQYEHVTIDQLSGGERQRVFLAQALAQEPEIILLDEPTNHLDLSYQKELLDLLNGWTDEKKLTVVAIFHDLNIASLYCDRLLLLNKGNMHVCDVPNKVLQQKHILQVYETEVEHRAHPEIPKLQVMLTPKQNKLSAEDVLNEKHLTISDVYISFDSPIPLKTLSSSSFDGGSGWFKHFINRYVEENNLSQKELNKDAKQFISKLGFEPSDSIVTYTSVNLENHAVKSVYTDLFSLFVVVTAGVSHAVDASLGSEHRHEKQSDVGTINTWVFIDGKLPDYTFVEAIITATEAKTKALQDEKVKDKVTQTTATGNPTDHILIATTQRGEFIRSAHSTSPLGAKIGEVVYQSIRKALHE